MTHFNALEARSGTSLLMKRMLCLLLSVALIAAWCPSGFATAETIATSPWTSDAIGQANGYSINDGGTAFTLNVTGGGGNFPDIFTSNLGGSYLLPAVVTVNAGFSSINFDANPHNVYGTIGAGASMADITLTGTAAVNFYGTVNTTTMHVATGTADFKSITNSNNAAITFTGDGTVILDSNTEVTGAITNQGAQQGTLTLNSASVLHGAVGGATGLKDVNIVGSGVSATISGAVNTYKIDLLTNTLNIGGALTVAPAGVINTTVTDALTYGKVITTGAVTIGTGTVINETINGTAPIIAATSIVSNYTAPITVVTTIGAGGTLTPTASGTIGSLNGSGTVDLGAGITLTTGSLNTTDSYAGVISDAGGLTKVGTGTLTLSGANTYTGATTVDNGTLKVDASTGSLAAASTLTFGGTGTFNYDNTTSAGDKSQNLGALTFGTSGDGTVQTTRTAAHNVTLTFASLAARQAGAAGNFVEVGGTAAQNKIVLTGTADKAFLGNGIFFGGSKYASVEGAGGYVRAYGAGDANYRAAPTGATIGASVNTDNVDLTTGNITAQTTIAANTIDMRSNNITMSAAGQILSTNGLLSSGGAAATLGSTGGILQATAAGNEMVVRVNGSGDALNIGSIIQNNAGGGTASALTKAGAGKLTLSGLNTYTGVTYLNEGTVNLGVAETVNTTGPLGKQLANAAGTIVLNGGTLQYSGANQNDYSGRFSTADYQQYNVDTNAQNVTWGTALTSSGGSLTKAGTGTLTLSDANTYTGATTVSAGTLKLGNATALGTTETGTTVSAGNVAALDLNGQTVGAEAVTLNGTGVGGAGALLNSNAAAASLSGLVTLATNSTITSTAGGGGLTLSGGISKDGKTLTLNGGAGAGAITVSGAITGASANSDLIVDNVTVNLNAANTYVGPTTIRSTGTAGLGILNANVAGALPTGTRTVLTLDDAGLGSSKLVLGASQFIASLTGAASSLVNLGANNLTIGTAAGSTTFAGVISGVGGSLTKDLASTQILSGANTYTGATTVNAGTLKAGVASVPGVSGAFGNGSAVTVATGATLDLNNFNETIGSLAGSGTVTNGAGGNARVLTTGGDNSSTTFSGVITEAGAGSTTGLTKVGTGTLTLSGANNYTGNTNVNGGTLAIGTNMTIGGNLTQGGGTLDLGTNTLTLGGNYVSGANTLKVSVNGANSGSINVVAGGGNANLTGGTINLTVAGNIAGGTTYNLINTGGVAVVGVPTITSNSAMMTFTQGATGVLTAGLAGSGFAGASTVGNTSAVGTVLNEIFTKGTATGDMATVMGTLLGMSSAAEVAKAEQTMTPDVSSGDIQASRAATANSFTMISNRLGGARNVSEGSGISSGDMTNGVGVWIQGLGSNMKQDERKGIQGFSANTFGTTIGADKVIDDHFRAGLAGGYGWAGVRSKTPGSPSDDINSYQATIYGSYDSLNLNKARQGGKKSPEAVRNQEENSWYVDGMLGFTENDYDSRREIWLTPATERVAKADHSGQQYSTNFEGGYTFTFKETKALEVTPFASIGYNYLRMNSYKEKGANALDLSVQGDGFHQLEQALGTKLAYPIVAKKMGTFIPSAKAAWLYDYIGDRFETNASFAGGGSSFTTKGAKPAKNGMLFGAELAFLNKGNVTVTGNWDITLKDQFMSNTYYGTVRYDF